MPGRKYSIRKWGGARGSAARGMRGRQAGTRRGQKSARSSKQRLFRAGYDRTAGYYGGGAAGSGKELKFHDVALDDAVIAAAGTVTGSVNLIAQGTTESTRIGRLCTLKSINWRYQISLPEVDAAATPPPGDTVRVIMYLDKQCNGAAANSTSVLETADFQSFNNLANKNRFVKLMDKTVSLNYLSLASDGAGVVSTADVTRNYTFFKKCDIPLEFDSTTGAITEIRSNNIGVLLISETGVSAFQSQIRLRFTG